MGLTNMIIGTSKDMPPITHYSEKVFVSQPHYKIVFENGLGFYILNSYKFSPIPKFFNRIIDSQTILEKEPLQSAATEGQLSAFVHKGFWRPMDTLRDKNHLEEMWSNGKAPWRVWH